MQNYFVMNDDQEETYQVETLPDGRYRVVRPSGDEVVIDAYSPEENRLHLLTEGGQSHDIAIREVDGDYTIQIRGVDTHVEVLNERQRRMRAAGFGGRGDQGPEVCSPMAGKVVAIVVPEGEVSEGDVVLVIEAMKMENDIKAHCDGTVTEVRVQPGDAVEIGDVLVMIEA